MNTTTTHKNDRTANSLIDHSDAKSIANSINEIKQQGYYRLKGLYDETTIADNLKQS